MTEPQPVTDQTAAPQPITHRRVLKIALPIVLSNATVPILGAVDVGVVGQMGAAGPIAAVALGAIVLSTVYWIFGFLRMGTTGMVGQAEGAGDHAEVSALLSRALIIAALAGVGLIVLQWPVFAAALWLSQATPEAEDLALTYMTIRIWTAPCAIAVYAVTGWLVAMERTGGVFAVQLVMNGVNIVLDLWFVLGLGWGVGGVAVATAIAEVGGAGLGLWLCRGALAHPAARDWRRVLDRARLMAMMVVNTDILIRSLLLMAMFNSFLFLGSWFGDVTVAANAVVMQFLHITAHAMDGFAFAAEALVARAFGRGDALRVRRSAVLTSVWGMVICVTMGLGFALLGPWAISVMARDEAVQAQAGAYLIWVVLAPPVGCAAWMLDGIFIGATRGRDMRNMMALSFGIYAVAAVILIPAFDNHGLWAALLVSFVARGATLGARYPALERAAAGGDS